MTQCFDFETIIIKDICTAVFKKDMLWSDLVAHTNPKPKCPLIGPSYTVANATIDFGQIANWPVDDYTWIVTFKAFRTIANVRH